MKNNLIFLIVLFASCNTPTKNINYPITKKEVVIDTYFGTDIEDPYRWLEDDLSSDTSNWVDSQNEVTFNYLDNETVVMTISNLKYLPKLLKSILGAPSLVML